jgi:hypothetical protein
MNVTLKLLVVLALMPLASVAAADQPARSKTRIQIEYLNVPDADLAEFRRGQHAEMRDYHQAQSTIGRVAAWYDYAVRFPLGTAAVHNRVVATVFTDERYIAERNSATTFQKYVVRRELYEPVYALRSPGYKTVGAAYSSINFLRARGGDGPFLSYVKAKLEPVWNERVAAGKWKTWGVFRRLAADPPAKEPAFTHVAVARLASFPEAEEPLAMSPISGAPALVTSELWKLENVVIAAH